MAARGDLVSLPAGQGLAAPSGRVGRRRVPRVAGWFPAMPASVAAARRFAGDVLAGWGVPLDEGLQVVGELAAEAVRGGAAEFSLSLTRSARVVRVQVVDGLRVPAFTGEIGLYAPSRRAVMMLRRLTTEWGCDVGADRRTVWADLPLRPAG